MTKRRKKFERKGERQARLGEEQRARAEAIAEQRRADAPDVLRVAIVSRVRRREGEGAVAAAGEAGPPDDVDD